MLLDTSTTACVQPSSRSRRSQSASTSGRERSAATGSASSAARQPRSESTPTRSPASASTDAVSQAVVVLPLVPVMAITFIFRPGSPAKAWVMRAMAQLLSGTMASGVPKVGMMRSATTPATPRARARSTSSWPSPSAVSRATNTSPGRQASGSSEQPAAMMSSQAKKVASGSTFESWRPRPPALPPRVRRGLGRAPSPSGSLSLSSRMPASCLVPRRPCVEHSCVGL